MRVLCFLLAFPLLASAAEPALDFNRDVRPILSDKCFACHGPDESHRGGKLRLDTEKDAKRVLSPGKPDSSELVHRITTDDESERMPPKKAKKPLTAAEAKTLTRWVAEGAKWSAHWAYIAPKKHPVPEVKSDWPTQWPDKFLLDRLTREKLEPSPDANPTTLVRRLHFDLVGLPPSPPDVADFLKEHAVDATKAIASRVDKLLASPHYGERMAMYWLDLVRYADTVGYHGDQDHHASPYRDWVIDAFNRNQRFDQFTIEQLAGDLLPNPDVDQKIATCYNRLLQTSHEGGVQPKEYLAIYAADRVRNVSTVWMGATVGCAQCHNHKFDPFSARDFYTLAAFFADVDEENHLHGGGGDTVPTKRRPEIPVVRRGDREALHRLDVALDRLRSQRDEAYRLADETPTGRERQRDLEQQVASAEVERKRWLAGRSRLVMVTEAVKPRTTRVFPRGNWLDETGEVVQPAIPSFMGDLGKKDRATRLDLAKWLTVAKGGSGGLTARVFVNRLWYLFFGVGLSRSLEDFGSQGEAPVHPELLDNLAVDFVDSGWDVKRLVKLIVTTRAYRQSSAESPALREKDPENRLYARQSRHRLAAEMVRDNALAVSGLLVVPGNGLTSKPYQPVGFYRHLNFPKREYAADKDAKQWQRGVYTHWQRQYLHPMLRAFDAPTREECTAQRPRSNTPLAALVLLNDPTFVEAARVFAERIRGFAAKTDAERIALAFQDATSRPPDEEEQALLVKLLESERNRYAADPKAAASLLAIGNRKADAKDPADLAAWTGVCRALLNLHETITRE